MAANANEKRKTVKDANIKKKFNTLNRFQNENTQKKYSHSQTLENFRPNLRERKARPADRFLAVRMSQNARDYTNRKRPKSGRWTMDEGTPQQCVQCNRLSGAGRLNTGAAGSKPS